MSKELLPDLEVKFSEIELKKIFEQITKNMSRPSFKMTDIANIELNVFLNALLNGLLYNGYNYERPVTDFQNLKFMLNFAPLGLEYIEYSNTRLKYIETALEHFNYLPYEEKKIDGPLDIVCSSLQFFCSGIFHENDSQYRKDQIKKIIKLQIEAGENVNFINSKQKTVLDYIWEPEILETILKYGQAELKTTQNALNNLKSDYRIKEMKKALNNIDDYTLEHNQTRDDLRSQINSRIKSLEVMGEMLEKYIKQGNISTQVDSPNTGTEVNSQRQF